MGGVGVGSWATYGCQAAGSDGASSIATTSIADVTLTRAPRVVRPTGATRTPRSTMTGTTVATQEGRAVPAIEEYAGGPITSRGPLPWTLKLPRPVIAPRGRYGTPTWQSFVEARTSGPSSWADSTTDPAAGPSILDRTLTPPRSVPHHGRTVFPGDMRVSSVVVAVVWTGTVSTSPR